MTNVVVVVPRRAGDPTRDRLWSFAKAWWEKDVPDWPIIEGHHDHGPFNRGAAINTAAAGEWDVAVIIDADVVADADQVKAAVDNAHRTGRLTLAYTKYFALKEEMTERVLDGYDGDWTRGAALKMTGHVSSILAVPRRLWDQVGGFDERFVGWGHDDVAFAAVCRTLGGGIDRIPGSVFHLWHGPTRRGTSAPRGHALLYRRYAELTDPAAMAAFIDQRDDPDQVAVVVTTHGRRECITESIASLEGNVKGLPIGRRIISDDSGDPDYLAFLRLHFPGWDITSPRKAPAGFGGNVAHAWDTALGSGQPWVFWAEDDFTYNQPVDLAAMAAVLTDHPHIAQMALRRQAWFPAELEAGGVVEQHPDDYTDRDHDGNRWLEHQRFWTTNPSLIPRRTLLAHPWPTSRVGSEAAFGRQVLHGSTVAGYWGARTDPPTIHHFGERTGTGY